MNNEHKSGAVWSLVDDYDEYELPTLKIDPNGDLTSWKEAREALIDALMDVVAYAESRLEEVQDWEQDAHEELARIESMNEKGFMAAYGPADGRFQRIADAIARDAGVQVSYHPHGRYGWALFAERGVYFPTPITQRSLHAFARECGHVACHHPNTELSYREEYEAEKWAHDALRRHDVPVAPNSTFQAMRYIARMIHVAVVRGATAIDQDAFKWCECCLSPQVIEWRNHGGHLVSAYER